MKRIVKLIILFLLVAIQLGLLGYQTSKGVKQGTLFTIPVTLYDPYDPLKGRYLRLRYLFDRFDLDEVRYLKKELSDKDKKLDVYVSFMKIGNSEYHSLDYIYFTKPNNSNRPFVKATLNYYSGNQTIHLDFTFDRYYIQDNYAKIAEDLVRDSEKKASLIISTDTEGEAKIEDLLIDDIPIKKYIEQMRKNR